MRILGIETSCDETSAAIVDDARYVRSNIVYSQIAKHKPYEGVVPEIACRAHVETLPAVVSDAVRESGGRWEDIDAVAVTHGPGLVGALLVGISMAVGLGLRLGKPVLGVNHIEAHLYSLFLDGASAPSDEVCPMLVLMVSGGHTLLVRMDALGQYVLLGQTLDDAAGEALDKGAAVLRLGYPGGPEIEKVAMRGDPQYVRFPRGLAQPGKNARTFGLAPQYCFSFSGLKTALLYYVRERPELFQSADVLRHVAASYQEAVFDSLISRLHNALENMPVRTLGCVGGVAKNQVLRAKLERLAAEHGVPLHLAPLAYCTDNAAMVAAVAGAPGAKVQRHFGFLDAEPNLRLSSV